MDTKQGQEQRADDDIGQERNRFEAPDLRDDRRGEDFGVIGRRLCIDTSKKVRVKGISENSRVTSQEHSSDRESSYEESCDTFERDVPPVRRRVIDDTAPGPPRFNEEC